MSTTLIDINVIDKNDFKEIKKLEGQKLKSVRKEDTNLVLFFEGKKLTISMQDSDAYGTNVFFEISKL